MLRVGGGGTVWSAPGGGGSLGQQVTVVGNVCCNFTFPWQEAGGIGHGYANKSSAKMSGRRRTRLGPLKSHRLRFSDSVLP